ncbi:hypothetical protein EON67_00375 [archaeon]|nr:MAG: hypothetical protein EON67_00375 [archaeon]
MVVWLLPRAVRTLHPHSPSPLHSRAPPAMADGATAGDEPLMEDMEAEFSAVRYVRPGVHCNGHHPTARAHAHGHAAAHHHLPPCAVCAVLRLCAGAGEPGR